MRLRLAPLAVLLTFCLATVTDVPLVAASSLDLKKAQNQFKRSCGTCHTTEPDAPERQGPSLNSIMGRQAGSRTEFTKYSNALKAAGSNGLVWSTETLDPWIKNARKYIPKTTMSYRQSSAEKRALIIAYLESLQRADTTQ